MDPQRTEIHPEAVCPKAVCPKAVDLEAVDLEAVDLEAVDPEAVDPEAVDPEAVDPEAVDPEAVDFMAALPTEMESLKTYEEVETIMLECNKQFLKIKAKWVELLDYQKETLELEEKFKEYKNDLLKELLEIETERNELLVEASYKIRKNVATDQCEDLLELNCALRRLSTRPKSDQDGGKTLLPPICEVADASANEKQNEKICSSNVLIDEVGHSNLLMDAMQKSDSALLAEEVIYDAPLEDEIFEDEKDLETVDRDIKEAVRNLHKALEEKIEAEKAFEKLNKELSLRMKEIGEHTESSSKPTLIKGKEKPSSMHCASLEKIVREFSKQLCPAPGEDIGEQSSDEEVYLANELKKAELEYEKSRREVIKETVNELRSWKADENEMLKKIATLRSDYERLYQENCQDTEVTFLILKNIDGLGSKLNVIESIVDFVKEESDNKIARLKLNFESKALAERLQLATAVKLLAQARKDPTAEAILGMLD